jgi:hypothetical protein
MILVPMLEKVAALAKIRAGHRIRACISIAEAAPGYSGPPQQPAQPPSPPVAVRVFDWLSQPRNPTCLAASTAAGDR